MKMKMTMAALLSLGVMSTANAGYIGLFSGNDDEAAVEAALGGVDVSFYDKAECNGAFAAENGLSSATGCPGTSGEWWTQIPIDYLTVKAGNEFTLYSYNPADDNDVWSTANLVNHRGNERDVSHISFWNKDGTSVPEPSAILLMGLGLLGLGLASRKQR